MNLEKEDILKFDELTSKADSDYGTYWKNVLSPYYEKYGRKMKYAIPYIEYIYLHVIDNWNLSITIPEFEEFADYYDNVFMKGIVEVVRRGSEAWENERKYGIKVDFSREEILLNTIMEIQNKIQVDNEK